MGAVCALAWPRPLICMDELGNETLGKMASGRRFSRGICAGLFCDRRRSHHPFLDCSGSWDMNAMATRFRCSVNLERR